MTVYALNGLGRIGKLALKPLLARGAEIAWINDAVGDAAMHAHLLEFDTVHGRWKADFTHDADSVTIDGTRLAFIGTKSIEDLPVAEREKLEKTVFRKNLDQVWEETRSYFEQRDPRQLERAGRDPKHKMALVFRWYLGQSPVWANQGVSDRKLDYQIWCGPAMGAFNEWVRGSFMEVTGQRRVATVAMNILFGAAVLMRASQLKLQGVNLEDEVELTTPLEIEQIKEFLS